MSILVLDFLCDSDRIGWKLRLDFNLKNENNLIGMEREAVTYQTVICDKLTCINICIFICILGSLHLYLSSGVFEFVNRWCE